MAAPLVSVICIYRDAEAFLDEAIASVLAQQGPAFELLLVDDGSRDASANIAARRATEVPPGQVRCLAHPGGENRGMSASRNLGLAAARGELIAFIDADDRWRPGKLAQQAALLAEHPAAAMVCGTVNYWASWAGGADRLVPTGPPVGGLLAPPETSLALYPLGRADAPCPSDVMIRADSLRAVGGFEDAFPGFYEDQAAFAKLYLAAPVLFAQPVWTDYRQHASSASAEVQRAGTYRAVRGQFLGWFAGWLTARARPAEAMVLRAVRREQWWLTHPLADRMRARWRRLIG